MTRFENVENVCSDVVNFKLNARKESKKVVLSSEARAALRSQLSLTYSTLYPCSTKRREVLENPSPTPKISCGHGFCTPRPEGFPDQGEYWEILPLGTGLVNATPLARMHA